MDADVGVAFLSRSAGGPGGAALASSGPGFARTARVQGWMRGGRKTRAAHSMLCAPWRSNSCDLASPPPALNAADSKLARLTRTADAAGVVAWWCGGVVVWARAST
ncbi:MAG: hypothetical protein ABI155_11080 [Paralcaligenes sp.]